MLFIILLIKLYKLVKKNITVNQIKQHVFIKLSKNLVNN